MLPVTANGAVWENVTKGRTGIRWNNVGDKVWKEIGGKQEEIYCPRRSLGGMYKAELKRNVKKKGRASVKKGGTGRTFRYIREVLSEETGMQCTCMAQNGLRENPETAISCRGLGPARNKKEVYQ